MSQKFAVTDDVRLEALGPDEAETPLVYIIFDDYPERQTLPIFAHEIKALVACLASADARIADQVEK